MLHYLIQSNYAGIIVDVFLFVFILTNKSFDKRTTKMFFYATLINFTLIIVDSIEFWSASLDYYAPIRTLTSAVGYTLRPIVALAVIIIIKRNNKYNNIFLRLPAIINALFSFSAFFTDIVYSFTVENVFIRGPLGYEPFIVSALYIIWMVISTLKEYNLGNKESYIVFAVAITCAISSILEAALNYRCILNVSCGIAITFYYLYLQKQIYQRDPLTNTLNRRCFYIDANNMLADRFVVISLDLNDLKCLNDKFGHAAGDKAICTMVECVNKSIDKSCRLYRTGGDEFMIICFNHDLKDANNIIDKLIDNMSKTGYSVACGIAQYIPGMNFDEVCFESDSAMYKNKVKMKSEMTKNEFTMQY